MSSSDLIRWGGLAAMIGCVVWLVEGLLILAIPQTAWTDVLFIIGILSVVAGLVGFHALQKDNYGRVGRGGLWTVVVATLAQVLGLAVFLMGSSALEWLVFPVGTSAVLIGFVLYGAATLQARVLPRWCGIAIIVAPFLFLLGDYAGALFGLVWLALGYVLWSRREAATGQPSRVS